MTLTIHSHPLDGPGQPPHGPRIRSGASPDPDASLGFLGWLAVLLAAVLVTALAYAGNVRAGQRDLSDPGLGVDPAYVLEMRRTPPAERLAE